MQMSAPSAVRSAARVIGRCLLAVALGACNPLEGPGEPSESAGSGGDQPDWQIVLENRSPNDVLLHVESSLASNESRVPHCQRHSQPFAGESGEWSVEVDAQEVVDSDRVRDLAGEVAPGQPVTVVIDVPPTRIPYVKSVIVGPFDASDVELEGCR